MAAGVVAMPMALLERLVCALERLAPAGASWSASDGLWTKKQVALKLGKSERDVERMVKRGALRKVPNLGSKTTRFRPSDVVKLLQSPEELAVGRRRL